MRLSNTLLLLSLFAIGCEAPAVASKVDQALVARVAVTAGMIVSDASAPTIPKQKVGDKCFYCNGVGKVSDGIVTPKTCIPCKGTGKVQPPDDSSYIDEDTGDFGPTDQPELTQDDLTEQETPAAEETTAECADGSCAVQPSYTRTYRRRLFRRW
jgi:hypothetical protein